MTLDQIGVDIDWDWTCVATACTRTGAYVTSIDQVVLQKQVCQFLKLGTLPFEQEELRYFRELNFPARLFCFRLNRLLYFFMSFSYSVISGLDLGLVLSLWCNWVRLWTLPDGDFTLELVAYLSLGPIKDTVVANSYITGAFICLLVVDNLVAADFTIISWRQFRLLSWDYHLSECLMLSFLYQFLSCTSRSFLWHRYWGVFVPHLVWHFLLRVRLHKSCKSVVIHLFDLQGKIITFMSSIQK